MEKLINTAKAEIPSLERIIDETWKQLNFQRSFVKNHFGEALISFDAKATEIFRHYERKALIKLAKSWLSIQKEEVKKNFQEILNQEDWDHFIEKASQIFVKFGTLVQKFEKDLGNMRKARGGKTFEKTVLKLLEFIDIKGETPTGRASEQLRRIDIVIPSTEVALETPDKAIFLTCKRTLRERWKQEVPQARLNQRIYLLTIDDSLPENKANEINQKGLIAFVRDELTKIQSLQNMPWIRKLSELPRELEKI